MESLELVILLGLLHFVHLSSSLDRRSYSLNASRMFYCESYFQFFTHSFNRTSFHLDIHIWTSKAPFKAKSSVWTAMFRPHKVVSLDVCVVWCEFWSCSTSFFALFFSWLFMEYFVFGILSECWMCLRILDQFLLTSFAGFGKIKEAKSLW